MSRIATGAYPVGSLLPTEHRLSEEFGRSRQTIREALRHLSQLGLVTRQPGIGTRVILQSPKTHYAYSISSLAELQEYAEEARLHILAIGTVIVHGERARLLECADATRWLHIDGIRHRRSDGVAMGVTEIYLRDCFDGVEHHLKRLVGATHVMLAREYGVVIDEIRQDARATLLSPEYAEMLDAEAGGPAMEVVRRYYLADRQLVLSGRIVYPAERFSVSLRFRRSIRG